MNIEEAKIEDSKNIVDLWEETNLLRPWNNSYDDIKKAITTKTSTLFIAKMQNEIIGTVMVGYDGHRG